MTTLKLLSKTPKGDFVAENPSGRIFTISSKLVTMDEIVTFENTRKIRNKVQKPQIRAKTGKTNVGDPMPHGFENREK